MANIILHSERQISATCVSNAFIDKYMSDANGEFVKIYLYLLRLMNVPDAAFSVSSIADKFDHTEKDVKRALCYWERMHLLRLEYDEQQNLTGICLLASESDSSAEGPADSCDSSARADTVAAIPTDIKNDEKSSPTASIILTAPVTVPKKQAYSADDIRMFRQNESVAELLFITERYLGRTLSATDVNTILYIYDGLKFSADLVEYLVEYCVSKGHTSIRYIEKVALGWGDSGITTVAEAKQAASLHSQTYFTVMKAFGISGRNLVPSEVNHIEKWKSEYGFTDELISAACQRTMQLIHQPSFEYTDSILKNWHTKQICSLEDVARLDAAYQSQKKSTAPSGSASVSSGSTTVKASRNKFNNFKQRSYDYDELEKMLLTTTTR